MAGKIKILADHIINQISAGEVVERPASVLKELTENSLDAGATMLHIECRGSGTELIRVTDDGEGMSRDDALLCLERHATSKIHSLEDMKNITTFGFRGEALPSLASVSEFTIRTCRPCDKVGTEVVVKYGKLVDVREFGCPPGTTVEVRRLFGNTPARKKFLKSPPTEAAHIHRLLIALALAHPNVAIHFRNEAFTTYDWPATTAAQRTLEVLGKDIFENLIFLDRVNSQGWRLYGWVSRQDFWHTSREHIYWFVNHRHVFNRMLDKVIREVYPKFVSSNRYPVAILHLDVSPDELDVNVHPCKREVRFYHENRLGTWLRETLISAFGKKILRNNNEIDSVSTASEAVQTRSSGFYKNDSPRLETPTFVHQVSSFSAFPASETAWIPADKSDPPQHGKPTFPTTATTQSKEGGFNQKELLQIKLLGCVRDRYWVGETHQGMILLDQQAARQRVVFERLFKNLLNGSIPGQGLLHPERITFTAQQSERLKKYIPVLRKAGLVIEEFGGNDFVIEALPPFWENGDNARKILCLIGDLEDERTNVQVHRQVNEQLIAKVLARQLTKKHESLSEKQAQELLMELLSCDLPYTTPEGHPTIILLTDRDIARRFGHL